MANTVDELSASNLVNDVQSKEQTTENVVCTKPPPYESMVNNTNTSLKVHYQSQLGSRDNNECTQAFINPRSTSTQSTDQIKTHIAWSIFNIFCCCLCVGCLACFYANKTQRLKEKNDIQGALKASKQARKWNMIGTIFGAIFILINLLTILSKQ